MQRKQLQVTLQKATSNGYDARFVVSSMAPDRVGDTFSKAALQKLTDTKRLIALFNHDPKSICGYWENFKVSGGKLIADLKLADTNLGKMIRKLLDSGVPLASSVGFRGLEAKENKHDGYEFNDVDLMEISVVSTPANPQAILLAKSFGFDEEIFTTAKASANETQADRKSEALKRINKSINRIQLCLALQKK